MSINFHVVKSTIVGALGGLLFGFDTAVISGTTNALTQTYCWRGSKARQPVALRSRRGY